MEESMDKPSVETLKVTHDDFPCYDDRKSSLNYFLFDDDDDHHHHHHRYSVHVHRHYLMPFVGSVVFVSRDILLQMNEKEIEIRCQSVNIFFPYLSIFFSLSLFLFVHFHSLTNHQSVHESNIN